MTGAKVVVIEPDSIQAAKWEALLRFLDYQPIVVPDATEMTWPSPSSSASPEPVSSLARVLLPVAGCSCA